MRKIKALSILFLLGPAMLSAQIPGYAYKYLDGNRVKARVYNSGDHFWDLEGEAGYEVPKGSGAHANFTHSLWVGGHDTTGTMHFAAHTYRQTGVDFFAGAYRPSHSYDNGVGFSVPLEPELRGVIPVDNGKVMAIYNNGFTVYDPATNASIVQSMPVFRERLQGALLSNGKVMLFGDNVYPNIQDVFLADAANGYSPQVSLQLHYYHRYSAAVTLPNGLTLIGGLVGSELYDPSTNTSSTVAQMPKPVCGAGSVLLPDGRVFLAGGAIVLSGFTGPRPETQFFDPATNTWTQGPNMPSGRALPLTLLQPNGRVLIIGGSSVNRDIFEFDPVANTITTVGALPVALAFCEGGILANGEVYFAAADDYFSTTSQTFRFIPSTGQVVEEGYHKLGIHSHVLPSGNVLAEFPDKAFREYDPVKHLFVEMPYQKVWKVTKGQITQFLADRANNTVDFAQYRDIQTWPAHGNVALGEDVHLAPFVDVNNDGLYRPLTQGDYPCILGDETLWWVFHEDGVHVETGAVPIGVQVEAMAYSVNCDVSPCPDSAIGYTTFYHYEISHRGGEEITDFRIGLWNDLDLGHPWDDFIGCDTTRNLGFVYNGDNFDEDMVLNDRVVVGYGANPPAYGSLILGQHEMANFMTYYNDSSATGFPYTGEDFHGYLASQWKDNSLLVDNGLLGHDPLSTGPFTNYIYPGDAAFCSSIGFGWSEVSAGNVPFDRRTVQSTAPFVFSPGDETTLDFAMVWARDPLADNLGAVCALQDASDAVQAYWTTMSHACFNQVVRNDSPRDHPSGFGLRPNPAQNSARVLLYTPAQASKVTVADLSGRPVYVLPIAEGSLETVLPLDMLPDGMYLVVVDGAEGRMVERLVVAR